MLYTIAAVFIGFCLDLMFGDPVYPWHPVRLIGNLITGLENKIRRISLKSRESELYTGGLLVILVLIPTFLLPSLFLFLCYRIHSIAGLLAESFFCYQILAIRSLKQESRKVYQALEEGNIEKARMAVSMIVGRDTAQLDEIGITKATIETIAENTSDGCIAPLFYLAVGGPTMGFLYKAVNTMDSMIGYKNETYYYFGRVAARFDDILNYIPSRISALLMISVTLWNKELSTKRAWKIFLRDRYHHASPNSAQTESVVAGALQIQLAGDATYFGKVYEKPTIGDATRPIKTEDINRANWLMYMTSVSGMVLFLIVRISVVFLMGLF